MRELVDAVAGRGGEQRGEAVLFLAERVHGEQVGACRDARGVVGLGQADEIADRVDPALGDERDQAARAHAIDRRGHREHGRIDAGQRAVHVPRRSGSRATRFDLYRNRHVFSIVTIDTN